MGLSYKIKQIRQLLQVSEESKLEELRKALEAQLPESIGTSKLIPEVTRLQHPSTHLKPPRGHPVCHGHPREPTAIPGAHGDHAEAIWVSGERLIHTSKRQTGS